MNLLVKSSRGQKIGFYKKSTNTAVCLKSPKTKVTKVIIMLNKVIFYDLNMLNFYSNTYINKGNKYLGRFLIGTENREQS